MRVGEFLSLEENGEGGEKKYNSPTTLSSSPLIFLLLPFIRRKRTSWGVLEIYDDFPRICSLFLSLSLFSSQLLLAS